MVIEEVKTGNILVVEIIPVSDRDYDRITKKQFWFNWKEEKGKSVYKLQIQGTDEILGLMSIMDIKKESRIEIRLLSVSAENRGTDKIYEHIIGDLITYASKHSLRLSGELACVSLIPKTEIVQHYIDKYGMFKAGVSLCLDGRDLINLINSYDHD